MATTGKVTDKLKLNTDPSKFTIYDYNDLYGVLPGFLQVLTATRGLEILANPEQCLPLAALLRAFCLFHDGKLKGGALVVKPDNRDIEDVV